MQFINSLGFKVFNDKLENIPLVSSKPKVINTISPNSYGISLSDEEFKNALKETDYLVLDGVYFALSSILTQGKNIKKNQGPEVFNHFIKRLNRHKGKVFFLGSSNETLTKIHERITKEYPDITFCSYSPPFVKEFSEEDDRKMIDNINEFEPDVVFIGMTCPKQEKWAIKYRDELNVSLIICIGNVFDWYSGNQKQIHPIWFSLRLGWLIRIFLRPEIFRRNIGNQLSFFFDLLLILIKIKKNK